MRWLLNYGKTYWVNCFDIDYFKRLYTVNGEDYEKIFDIIDEY